MWSDESERIGKWRCTPVGYALHELGGWIWLLGVLSLLLVPLLLIRVGIMGTFRVSILWVMALPPGLMVLGVAMYHYSCWLAGRKGFHYDYKRSEASWIEAGERTTYRHDA